MSCLLMGRRISWGSAWRSLAEARMAYLLPWKMGLRFAVPVPEAYQAAQ